MGARLGAMLLLALPAVSMTQSTGRIQGIVVDAEAELPGVNVYLEETGQGTASGLEGQFEIVRIRPGTYTLVASLLGYGIQRQQVTVTAGQTTEVTLTLTSQPIDLGEVLAQADRSFSAASSMAVRTFDLITRPTRSAQDLLVP